MSVTIRVRRGTATQWAARTTPLLSGEFGYDLTNKITKIGDGTTLWASLPSIDPSSNGTNTGDITFDGVQIIGAGTASGDGYGNGTIELVPDADINTDQYLIIDPTAPNHIHIRGGGTQDASGADVFIGGERNNVRVSDGARSVYISTRPETVINTYTNLNETSNTSFIVSSTANIYVGDTMFYPGGDIVTVDSVTENSPSTGLQTITANLNGEPASFVGGAAHVFNHEEFWDNYWQFGSDGVLHGPGGGTLIVSGISGEPGDDVFAIVADQNLVLQHGVGGAYLNDSTIANNHIATMGDIADANEYTDQAVAGLDNSLPLTYVPLSDVGQPDGVASLDEFGKIPDSEISTAIARLASPTFTGTVTTDDLIVDGDLTVNGTNFAASATSITIEDNLVQLAHGNTANTVDLGLVVGYNDGTAKHAGIVRDVSTNKWKLFKGVTTEPTTTVDFTQGSLDDLEIAGLTATSATFTGTVSGVTATHVGLGNVDNTSDANKPVSTATQTALNAKLDSSGFTYASITIPVYSTIAELPSAASNHGRWAHVHGEGAMFFAHGGSWYRALSESNLYVSTNAQGGSYTLATSDLDKTIEMSGGGTLTVTDSSSFPVGFTCNVLQTGSSQVSIAGNGFTVNGTPGLKLRAQWSSATLVKRSLNSWVLMGDLST
jgi:hypothetical protein